MRKGAKKTRWTDSWALPVSQPFWSQVLILRDVVYEPQLEWDVFCMTFTELFRCFMTAIITISCEALDLRVCQAAPVPHQQILCTSGHFSSCTSLHRSAQTWTHSSVNFSQLHRPAQHLKLLKTKKQSLLMHMNWHAWDGNQNGKGWLWPWSTLPQLLRIL